MDHDIDWEARERLMKRRLLPLAYLVGDWVGVGVSHGAPVQGRLQVRQVLGGTFVEAREVLRDASGAVDHEDLCVYRYDTTEKALRVTQYLAPGWVENHVVESLPSGGIRWRTGPLGPRVELSAPEPDTILVRVWLPAEEEPAHVVRYVRQ
ncbi:MAG: hypothetical protein VX000_02990 [Myxococcota bacterium]|nr:hypothetical protein [Myxococcota bacterium]